MVFGRKGGLLRRWSGVKEFCEILSGGGGVGLLLLRGAKMALDWAGLGLAR